MAGFVGAAHEDMLANVSDDPTSYMRQQLRWQQREAMYRGIMDYVAKCDHDRKRILQEIAEREKEYNASQLHEEPIA